MKNDKFLNLNGKSIFFQHHDGKFWIAIKPICELLEVDYIRVFKNLKEDKILNQLLSDQTMVGADNRRRKMISLPEKYIYGWMFSLQSKSNELYKFKLECYDVLFDYFRGVIAGREELLKSKIEIDEKISKIETSLAETEDYKELKELKKKLSEVSKGLKNNDNLAEKEIKNLFNYGDDIEPTN